LNSQGNLELYHDGNLYQHFGVTVDEDNWFVGDDILLAFDIVTPQGIRYRVEAENGDRAAIMDYRAIWRGNLYIDDGIGDVDWNNAHRWVHGRNLEGEIVAVNEWNRYHDGETLNQLEENKDLAFAYRLYPKADELSIEQLDNTIVGGQVVTIPEWTRYSSGVALEMNMSLEQLVLII
jgi:hypothetical protein